MKKLLLGLVLPPILASFLHGAAALSSIPFSTSQAQFAPGDSITVQEVLASSPNLGLGDSFIVRGTYTLQSQSSAIMGISLTTREPVGVPSQATARKEVAGGTGTFEMQYTVQFEGTIYIAFTPTAGGSSFGRIYVSGAQGAGPGSTSPTPPVVAPPTVVVSSIDTTGVVAVPFTTSHAQFVGGDAITIQQVLATSPRLEPGDVVLVRGQYALQSAAQATLMISLTVNAPGYTERVSPSSRQTVSGTGTFEVAYEIKQPGSLHVSFYPTGSGSSFGGVYFAPPGGTTSNANSAVVAVNNPAANSGKLGNLAVRSMVSAGEGTLVAGVTVTDQERYVLIRGVGPSLTALGVGGALRKPVLTVYNSSGDVIASAASWSAAFTGDRRAGIEMLSRSVGAFPLTSGSEDAVLNLRLTPGGYTVSVSTGDGQPGVALLEIYASSTYSLPAP